MRSSEYKLFPRPEYELRWRRAKELMEKGGFDALFITEPLNYHYLSGASPSFSYTRATIIVFPREEDPVIIAHEFVEESTRRETWIDDVRIYRVLTEAPFALIKEVFKELGLAGGRIGAELGFEQRLGLSFNDFLRLKQELPKARFMDASHIFWRLRMIKSRLEAELVRKACEITSRAYEECFESISEGMTEKEVGKIFLEAMTKRGGTNPWCFINSGPHNYSVISGSPTNNRLKRGNIIWIDGGCAFKGYGSDFSRIAAIGRPSERQKKRYEETLRLTEVCVDAVKPGVRASEIADICEAELGKRGLELTFRAGRIGHGIGLMLTEPPHIASYDNTTLETGMTVTIEPGFVTDYGVFQAEQNILITKDSHEVLSLASAELHVI